MTTFFICFYLATGIMVASIFERDSKDNKVAVFLMATVLWFFIILAVFVQEHVNKKE